jgi:hypothetical protein
VRGRPLLILLGLGLAALCFFGRDGGPSPDPMEVGMCVAVPSANLLTDMETNGEVELAPASVPCSERPNLLILERTAGPLTFGPDCAKGTDYELTVYEPNSRPYRLCLEEQS